MICMYLLIEIIKKKLRNGPFYERVGVIFFPKSYLLTSLFISCRLRLRVCFIGNLFRRNDLQAQ